MSDFDWSGVVEEGVSLRSENGVAYLDVEPDEDEGARFFTAQPSRAFLSRLSRDPFHQANWELESYCPILRRFLEADSKVPAGVVADLGSGDGRFSLWLLRTFPVRVVAVDVVGEALADLAESAAREGFQSRILLVRSDIERLPLRSESIDAALAINSLYYLGERMDRGVAELARVLRSNGTAVTTRHIPEAVFLRTLIFNGLKPFLEAVRSGTAIESGAPEAPRFPLLSETENRELFARFGLLEAEEAGIPLFEQLVSLSGRTDPGRRAEIEANENELRDVMSYLRSNSPWYRTMVLRQIKTTA
jgi:ubiquinone/menaquinone biosynthesis C-methylase UbiE